MDRKELHMTEKETKETEETEEQADCEEWLENQGRCDLKAGHYPETRHLLVNIDSNIYWKVIWPFPEDDPDVQHWHAVAQAYEEEDDRRMAAEAAQEEAASE